MRLPILLAIVTTSSIAAAQPPGLTPPQEPAAPERVEVAPAYRLQTAGVDLSALVMMSTGSSVGVGVGVATLALGAPALHLYHHQPGRAVASLGLRVGLPLAGMAIGAAGAQKGTDAEIALPAIGAVIGVVAASAIDIGYLSRAEDTAKPARVLAPTFAAGPNGNVRFGIGGTF